MRDGFFLFTHACANEARLRSRQLHVFAYALLSNAASTQASSRQLSSTLFELRLPRRKAHALEKPRECTRYN